MLLNPSIIALITGSLLVSAFVVYGSLVGSQILRWWDIGSGSDRQLALERKTYLVSTILAYVAAFEIFSLALFVHTADDIHTYLVGAMCAAGSLNANPYGYATLLLKLLNVLLCGLWLIVNYTDNKGFDYPVIRPKYKFLLPLTASILLETFLQTKYFMGLEADVITSCCGTLFSEHGEGLGQELAGLPAYAAQIIFYLSVFLAVRAGIHFIVTGRGAKIFSWMATWAMAFSIAAVISFISVYYYELPTHHCPFCLLQADYHYIGYLIYPFILGPGITGAGVGVIDAFGAKRSLVHVVPRMQKRLCILSVSGYILLTAVASYPLVFSDFRL
jgi:hypothetical protein